MKKHLNVNTVLIGLLIVVSLSVFGYQKFFKNSLSADNGIAEVYVGNQVVKRIPLNKDETYTITQGLLTCTIDVKDGKAAFINQPVPGSPLRGFRLHRQRKRFCHLRPGKCRYDDYIACKKVNLHC